MCGLKGLVCFDTSVMKKPIDKRVETARLSSSEGWLSTKNSPLHFPNSKVSALKKSVIQNETPTCPFQWTENPLLVKNSCWLFLFCHWSLCGISTASSKTPAALPSKIALESCISLLHSCLRALMSTYQPLFFKHQPKKKHNYTYLLDESKLTGISSGISNVIDLMAYI